jgi:hypothetical protein
MKPTLFSQTQTRERGMILEASTLLILMVCLVGSLMQILTLIKYSRCSLEVGLLEVGFLSEEQIREMTIYSKLSKAEDLVVWVASEVEEAQWEVVWEEWEASQAFSLCKAAFQELRMVDFHLDLVCQEIKVEVEIRDEVTVELLP